MKNDIKKHLTLGAVLAGSVFMISCDDKSNAAAVSLVAPPVVVTPDPGTPDSVTPDSVTPDSVTPVAGIGTIITDAATLTARGSGANSSFLLKFDADPTMTMFTHTFMFTTGFVSPGTDIIEQGDAFDLSASSGTVINLSGVTGSGDTLTIANLDSPPGDQNYSDLVLTETSSTTIGNLTSSAGTFTLNADVAVMGGSPLTGIAGINNPPSLVFSANSAPTGPEFGGVATGDYFNSTSVYQSSITVPGAPVFMVAPGDTVFIDFFSLIIYITDRFDPNFTLTDATPHDLGVDGGIDVAPGKIVRLQNGGTPASTVPLKGTFRFEF